MASFIDEVKVEFVSGTGGSGAVAFHREKHVPRGGPNGADGGRGGDVVLVASRGCRTLFDLRLMERVVAQNGVHAIGNKKGKNGQSIEIKVPVGTVISEFDSGDMLADLKIHGMKFVICKGGRGGHGNLHYVSSVRQVPNFAEKGEPGERRTCKLELKLLADVGLVGLPNAGKSTLLSQVSAARPKIADYPFTTIVPNLGVVSIAQQTFVMADLPGLIEGASDGHGLGHQFLRHVERTKVLVHVVDCFPIDESDPLENYELIEAELKNYSEEVYKRPRVIALNKMDLAPTDGSLTIREKLEAYGYPVFAISAATGVGIQPLLYHVLEVLESQETDTPAEVKLVATLPEDDGKWEIHRDGDSWEILGKRVSRMVAMTDLTNKDAVRYLHRRLNRIGVIEDLRQAGAQEGDTVYVGEAVFSFTDEL